MIRQKTVSIVDDDPLVRGAIERLLRAYGFDVMVYESAEAFLGDKTANQAACLVLDVSLGGISGIELGRRLAASKHRPPIIFITAVDSSSAYEEAMETGCVAYLRKPFPARELIGAIAAATA